MRAEWIFLREDLFNKFFWKNEFLAKYVSTKPEICGRTETPILPGFALTVFLYWLISSLFTLKWYESWGLLKRRGPRFVFQIMKFGIVIFFNLTPTGKKWIQPYYKFLDALTILRERNFFYNNSKNDSNFVAALHMVQKEEN